MCGVPCAASVFAAHGTRHTFAARLIRTGLRAVLIKTQKSVPARFFVPQTEQVCRGTKKGCAGAALRHNCSGTKKAWREGRPKPHFRHRSAGKMAISPPLVVGSHRPGYYPNALDPARRSMPYLPLTQFFSPLYDHSPPAGRPSGSLARSRPPITPVFPPHQSNARRRKMGT